MSKTCYHCGSPSQSWVRHDDKDFCCEGCVMVYDILKENDMGAYYDIENAPGIRNKKVSVDYYDYLDQEDIKRSVLDFYDGSIGRIKLYIPAIHCSSCIWLIENLHRLHRGVIQSTVNFNRREAAITFNEEEIKLSELMTLLASINYKPHIKTEEQKKSAKRSKQLLIKLGIAGFIFGNVMLLSFPDYLSEDITLNPEIIAWFKWISVLLSIPAMFYSGNEYFIAAWKNIKRGIVSIDMPIAIGITAIFVRSLFEIITNSGSGYLDSLTGLVFFLLIGKWYQAKTYEALSFDNDYSSYFPLGITRIVNNNEEIVPISELQSGDTIQVRNGEIIPADASLLSIGASVDYSFITGESVPVRKEKGDLIYAGGRVLGNALLLEVQKKVETGYLAELWKERSATNEKESMISHTLNVVSKYFTIVIILISTLTGLYWAFVDGSKAVMAFTSVLIIACPCALALSVPFAFGHAGRILGKNHLYLKLTAIIEKLTKVDAIVFDKTGTLTDPEHFEVEFKGDMPDRYMQSMIKSLAHQSRHPLSRALAKHLEKADTFEVFDFEEQEGAGVEAQIMNHQVKLGSAQYVQAENQSGNQSAQVYVRIDERVIGYYTIKNYYRPDWQKMLQTVQQYTDVHILSGDNDAEQEALNAIVQDADKIHFFQTPKDKQAYVQALKAQGKTVMMVGDGLNDVGALKEAHVGIAVADDVHQFSPSSDAIISAGELKYLPRFISFSRASLKIVYASIIISFLYNVVGLSFAVSGQLSPLFAAILMPLSSVSVVVYTSVSVMMAGKRRGL
ncbi:heavy metal translocating P-type ATPase metal-binding domain-containing protein [Carboxylicivirga sediminis]|uniref:Heavy metal translocating P-type ATPase metal-binding domain-containing protein n=1 Tax=Carboxylicivirga sediminis TaxID=2006564 RepID=A0A941F3V6_9BACT|nr:heavy metal translocating P-type ATPase metal-binding domain-containing protein [Carboxylicivirga sediminis]MBR8535474.1 heavy metal translocating P-type ATPase metal-binding domain-containing protein [Carboxylicivirga sediminis]